MSAIIAAPKPPDDGVLSDAKKAVRDNPNMTPTQAVRELLGLSQEELAFRSGVCRSTIASLENGLAPDALLLATVAYTLGVPHHVLLPT
jgi:DNA-binding XRE family transcriptional regulator